MKFHPPAALATAVLAVLGSGPISAAVDPGLLNLVMPDAKIIAGVQVEQVLASPFGHFLVGQMPANGFSPFAATTGFDLQHDLREVVVATASLPQPGTAPSGLVLVRGNFDTAKLLALAAVTGTARTNYRDLQIITPNRGSSPSSFVFLDSSTLLAGPFNLLQAAINRAMSGATYDGELARKSQDASDVNDIWFATVTPIADLLNGQASPVPVNLLSMIQGISGGVHFDQDGALLSTSLATRTDQEAQNLAGALKLILSMVKTNAQALPIGNAQFMADGPVLKLTMPVPESQLEQSMHPPSAGTKKISVQR